MESLRVHQCSFVSLVIKIGGSVNAYVFQRACKCYMFPKELPTSVALCLLDDLGTADPLSICYFYFNKTCTHTNTHTHKYTHSDTSAHAHSHARTYLSTHTHTHTRTHTHAHTHTHTARQTAQLLSHLFRLPLQSCVFFPQAKVVVLRLAMPSILQEHCTLHQSNKGEGQKVVYRADI
jgi:ABC-type Zn2+ transport system substrate-binding protein/surface adhesin